MIISSELFSQINCIEPHLGIPRILLKTVIKLPIFISTTALITTFRKAGSWSDMLIAPIFYVLCHQAACETVEMIHSWLGKGWDVKFSLLECICLQTSKLLRFSTEQNGNRTFYHLGCSLLPTALPAQQLPRAGAKPVQIRGQKQGHTPGYCCGHPLTAERCQDEK